VTVPLVAALAIAGSAVPWNLDRVPLAVPITEAVLVLALVATLVGTRAGRTEAGSPV
jgi:hypothetical protein